MTTQAIGQQHTSPLRAGCEAQKGKGKRETEQKEHTLPRLSRLFGAEFFLEFYGPAR